VVIKTEDGGVSWTSRLDGLPPNEFVDDIAVAPSQPNVVYVAMSRQGVYRSAQCGNDWQERNGDLPLGDDFISNKLAVDPTRSNRLFLAFSSFSIPGRNRSVRTTNIGFSWQLADAGLPREYVYALAVSAQNPARLYASTYSGLFGSSDGGDSWQLLVETFDGDRILHIALDSGMPDHLYAATRDRIFQNHDGGLAWYPAEPSPLTPLEISDLAYEPEQGLLYVGTDGGLFSAYSRASTFSALSPVGLAVLGVILLAAGIVESRRRSARLSALPRDR